MNVIARTVFSTSVPISSAIGFWDIVFTFYSLVPYLVPMAIALEMIVHRRTWTRVFAVCFIPMVTIINAVVLVTSLGDCNACKRPCGSCVSSNGLPSGHATNAIGFSLWIVLEALVGGGKQWTTRTKVTRCGAALVLFLPVPYSRMYVGDHTELQVVIGSADGIVFGLLYFLLLRYVVAKRLPRVTERMKQGRWRFLNMVNDFYVINEDDSSSLSPLVTSGRSESIEDVSVKV
uniref:Phosphatidic acid phosphatase type 2/haloperoxidase domain-containing protein n=1 Tax=Peronospora matthiolae TaxID=2874970 RepID=A0AAV1TQY1_9STRA